jgi:DNA (cytosine-5)-methyltransferase 1
METLAKRKGVRKAMQHNLTASVQYHQDPTMWPTPIASTGGPYKNHKGDKKKVPSSGNPLATAVAMWSTPTANEDAAGTPNGKMQGMLGNHPEVRGTTPEEWKKGSLNPNWVEWLMGYPRGWTDLTDGTQSQKTSQE